MLPACLFSTCVTPGSSFQHTSRKRTLHTYIYMYMYAFLALWYFFLFRPRVFPRALGSVARREPARTPYASWGPGRGPWYVLWGFKMARALGEAFRARRAIQVHANPRTYILKYVIKSLKKLSGVPCDINVVRHYHGDGKGFPWHQHARHATIYSILN